MNKLWKSISDFFRRLYSRVAKVFKTDSRNNSQNTSTNKSDEIVYAELDKNVLNKHRSKETIKRGNNHTIYAKVKGSISTQVPVYENIGLNKDPIYENVDRKPPLPPKERKQKNNINDIKHKSINVSNSSTKNVNNLYFNHDDR